MKLHVLTAVTRPENLPRLAESIANASDSEIDIVWHWKIDWDHTAIGGQRLKNEMLDDIQEGWVYILDDDTLMHPDLLKALAAYPQADAIVVTQERAEGRLLHADPGNLGVGTIDIGQALLRRFLIGSTRIQDNYEGDGAFLQEVLADIPGVVFIDETLSYHNALEWVAV